MYVCDWYNPVKGMPSILFGMKEETENQVEYGVSCLKEQKPGKSTENYWCSLPQLLNLLKRPEYRYRYWAKRENSGDGSQF